MHEIGHSNLAERAGMMALVLFHLLEVAASNILIVLEQLVAMKKRMLHFIRCTFVPSSLDTNGCPHPPD